MKSTLKNILLIVLCIGCHQVQNSRDITQNKPDSIRKQRPVALQNGKFFNKNGERYLYGGEDSTQHFKVTDYDLKDEQFHYGIGREAFPALLDPVFISVEAADQIWSDTSRFLVGYIGNEVKAYAVKDLTRHEIVNDMLGGKPIMAAYCILADLGAIYERTYNDKVFTFGLSGYTYYDKKVWNGLDGFILWDRETESLWWPLTGKAVSGPMRGVQLLEMDKAHWEDTQWSVIKEKYPSAKVLKSGQDFDRPVNWEKYEDVSDIVKTYSTPES